MKTTCIWIILCIVFVLLMICLIWRRERSKRKIRKMCPTEKWCLLSELTEPFGFAYEPVEDIFTSCLDAWQRREGYEMLYDKLAPKFNMIFDSLPVYFDYRGKTWMIELWKGQYGINTGCEAGVYHTNRIIPAKQRKLVHYNAVSDKEMPLISFCLEKKRKELFSHRDFHWWLTGFRMGTFSRPEDLIMHVKISFLEVEAAQAFYHGLQEIGYPENKFKIQCQTVLLVFDQSKEYTRFKRCRRSLVQCQNRIFCCLYRLITMPFTETADRMLFLYYQLPWCFRHMLRLHAFGRKSR